MQVPMHVHIFPICFTLFFIKAIILCPIRNYQHEQIVLVRVLLDNPKGIEQNNQQHNELNYKILMAFYSNKFNIPTVVTKLMYIFVLLYVFHNYISTTSG